MNKISLSKKVLFNKVLKMKVRLKIKASFNSKKKTQSKLSLQDTKITSTTKFKTQTKELLKENLSKREKKKAIFRKSETRKAISTPTLMIIDKAICSIIKVMKIKV